MKLFRLAFILAFGAAVFAQDHIPRQTETDDQQAERQEWFYEQRSYPLGRIPAGARIRAIEATKVIEREALARRLALKATVPRASTDASTWSSIGPRPTDQGTVAVSAGRVNAIAIDPRSNDTVYIGAAEGGVWKTTDGGANWIPLTDDQVSLANGAIAIDPQNPDTIYVGTGEENFAQDSYYGAGILKSNDGGSTWTSLVGPFLRSKIGALAIHPSNSQVLLCSADTGIWRSADGAVTWTRTLSGSSGTAVTFDPTDGNIAYAALGLPFANSLNGVYRSSDGGRTWKSIAGTGANSLPASNVGRISIAIAPSTPTILYAALEDISSANSGKILGLWKTTDSGGTWNRQSSFPSTFCNTQCWFDMTLAVHPGDPQVVYAGGFEIARSLDGGATWTTLAVAGPNKNQLHPDQHFLAFTADASKLFIGNDGGVYSTTDISDPAVNWTPLNDTLAITQFYPGLSAHPLIPDWIVGGAQDNGTQLYTGHPNWLGVTCGDGGYTAIDPTRPSSYYAACQRISVEKTADGNLFIPAVYGIDQTDRTQFISPLAMDPSNPETLYFGTYRLWRTQDGGGRWVSASPDLTLNQGMIKAVAVAPSDVKTIYVGTSDGSVQVTANVTGGSPASWSNRSAGLPKRTVTHIEVDPVDAMTAYVSFSGFAAGTANTGHIFKTSDGAASWVNISGNLPDIPVNAIVVDPDIPDTLYVGTDAGAMVSGDGGGTWTTLGAGLPRVVVTALALHRNARVLRAATQGRSVWEIAVPAGSGSLQPQAASITPALVNAGSGDLTVTITGSNFGAGTVVRWNGSDLATTIVDGAHLTAVVPASDLTALGRGALTIFNPNRGGGISNPMSLNIGPGPASKPEAFVNAANPAGGNVLAPRSIATLFGVNLAGHTSVADSTPPLPFTLDRLTLNLNGNQPVPLFFVSPGQVNFQVPFYGITQPTAEKLIITQGGLSTTISVTLQPYAPALFTANSQGTGQASALISGTGALAAPDGAFDGSRPAKKGEYISLYCTGLGDVKNRPLLGSASPSTPLATTLTDPTVSIGGLSAEISFSGLAPGYIGLYQVNVKVPESTVTGPAVPVTLSIGGVRSNTVSIAIQ